MTRVHKKIESLLRRESAARAVATRLLQRRVFRM